MIRYLLRRIGYGFLILIGVNLLTFMLFFTCLLYTSDAADE